jgi:uncharacterized protein (DUF305 family)
MGGSSHRLIVKASVLAMVFVSAAASIAGTPSETAFLAENDAAMKTMMANMAIRPSGDVDRDFVAMMVPHHEGAIAMAQAQLRYGRNEQLRRLAQEIIVSQSQEIATMRLAIGEPGAPSAALPTPSRSTTGHSHAEGDGR